MVSTKEQIDYSKFFDVNSLKFKFLFFNAVITLSFLRLPYMIIAFLIVVFLEYFTLNYFWKNPRLSLTFSFLSNIYSCIAAVPLLVLPLIIAPTFVGVNIIKVITQVQSKEITLFTIIMTFIGSLIIFGIAFLLTLLCEYAIFACFNLSTEKKKPLFLANIISYTVIYLSAFFFGIIAQYIHSIGGKLKIPPLFITISSGSEVQFFIKNILTLTLIFMIINIFIICFYLLKRKEAKTLV